MKVARSIAKRTVKMPTPKTRRDQKARRNVARTIKRKTVATTSEDGLIPQLAKLPLAERISLVAKDVKSRKDIFRPIGPYLLAKLLGVRTDGVDGSWPTRANYVWLRTLEEFLDHHAGEPDSVLERLRSSLLPDRLNELEAKFQNMKEIAANQVRRHLSKTEIKRLLHADAQYRLENYDYLPLAITEVENDQGVQLMFECRVGDGGDVEDLKDPYDFREDKFTDTSDAAIVDPCG